MSLRDHMFSLVLLTLNFYIRVSACLWVFMSQKSVVSSVLLPLSSRHSCRLPLGVSLRVLFHPQVVPPTGFPADGFSVLPSRPLCNDTSNTRLSSRWKQAALHWHQPWHRLHYYFTKAYDHVLQSKFFCPKQEHRFAEASQATKQRTTHSVTFPLI